MSTRFKLGVACVAAGLALLTCSARAGTVTYDFTTDPTATLQIAGADGDGVPWDPATGTPRWQAAGGNPGGFLALTYATTYFNTHIIFPDLDPGKVVTAFTFECDVRVGNGSDRPADGFSINFARSYDEVINQWDTAPGRGYRGDTVSGPCTGCESLSIPETGTRTGIAISFDTWAGNTLNDGADLEGIIVAVDGATVLQGTTRGFPMPTRYGACDDITSLQTGARDTAFWTNDFVLDPLSIYTTNAWDTLCWQHLKVEVDATAKLTVIWKGNTLLDKFQTAYFPTPGRLIFGGRTGGSHEQTHIDNIVLTTTAVPAETQPPTDPSNLRTTLVGARRVALQWDPSVERPDPLARLAYQVSRDGVVIAAVVTDTNYVDAPGPDQLKENQLAPSTAHTYSVLAKDLNANVSGSVTLAVTLLAEVPVPGYFTGQVYTNVTGTQVDTGGWLSPPGWPFVDQGVNYPNNPGKVGWWLSGMSFNQPSGAWGDNFGFRFTGTLTPPKTGQYRFFVRSDDASQFWLNPTGPALPNEISEYPIAQEDDCCDAFAEPGSDENMTTVAPIEPTGTFPTSAAITLTAGTKYGFVWLVKEGGGGDMGQVAWRMEGDTTAASSLPPIGGLYVEPTTGGAVSDPGGASVAITQEPQDTTGGANAHLNLWVATTVTSPWGYGAVYQWYKDGVAIMNAARTNLYIDVLAPADAGLYKVFVTVPGASTYSREATLAVTNDLTLPTIAVADVHGSQDLTHLTVRFSEPVTSPTATTFGNYTIAGLAVSAATRVDAYTINLTTAAQTSNTKYTLTVNNVADNAGNIIAADTKVDWMSWVMVGTAGPVTAEIYNGLGADGTAGTITGTTVALLTAYAGYPASPDVTTNITGWNTRLFYADDTHENYGARLSGSITPTVSGDYRFFIYSDDSSELWLSTDNTEANLVKIAEETGCCNPFTEPGTARTSNPIPLVGGQSYFMRGIYKEGGGGDYLQVAWRKEGDGTPAASLPTIPQAYDPWVGAPIITQAPTPVAYAKGETITRSVVAGLGARSLTYQWYKNNTIIDAAVNPSAATATLTIPNAGINDMADYKCTVSNPAGSATSNEDNGRAWMKGMTMLIEAEDFNYNSGQIMAAVNTLPYLGDAYKSLTNQAVANVDFFANGNDAGADALAYGRFAQTNTAPNFIEMKGGTPASNNDGGSVSATARFRGDFTVNANYALGWTVNGQWQNYTRTIPAGTYQVIGGFANDGRGANAIRVDLSTVANATIADGSTGTGPIVAGDLQGVTKVGTFLSDGTGAWSSDDLVPLKTDAGEWALVTAPGGPMTFRMTSRSGPDLDYFALYLSGVVPQPDITSITVGAGGAITITWTGGGTLQAAASVTGPWQDVTGATSPYTFTPTEPMLFGRIIVRP